VRFAEFTDGLSNTLLVGEKHVPMGMEGIGAWDCSTYDGGQYRCSVRSAGGAVPLTTDIRGRRWVFGRRHTGIVNFCFADGHVKAIPVTIDPGILGLLSDRRDGQVIPEY